MNRLPRFLTVLTLSLIASACDGGGPPAIEYEIVATMPHDTGAYTQGLLVHDGQVYESTGQHGRSTVRRVDVETGEVLAQIQLDSTYFGEGLARVGNELYQLTYRSGLTFVYDLESLELLRQYEYEGEGWGLCYDGAELFMSNGSSVITVRDPETFEATRRMEVFSGTEPVRALNELECVGDHLWANVYLTDRIVKIDKATGNVVGELDGTQLSIQGRRPPGTDFVLNGIAYIPETGLFLMTGKNWPNMMAVRINDG